MTFQWPMRSASLPSREADRMLPNAAADITYKAGHHRHLAGVAHQLRDIDR